jgi:hypothetical protein
MPLLETIGSGAARGLGLFGKITPNHAVTNPVTSGLQFYYDASNLSSYSGSGSTWNDLSGNGRHASVGGAVSWVPQDGVTPAYFNFPNTSDNDVVTYSSSVDITDVIFGVYISSAGIGTAVPGLYVATATADKSLRYGTDAPDPGFYFRGQAGAINPTDQNDWNHNASVNKTFFNGTSGNATSTYMNYNQFYMIRSPRSAPLVPNPSPFKIGGGATTSRTINGRINFAMGFNRQLSDAEVNQIWDAYKSRLGYV